MNDLKQVAERLTRCNHVQSASGACQICHKGKEAIEASLLAKDWLAERDPTPLTVEVFRGLSNADINSESDTIIIHVVIWSDYGREAVRLSRYPYSHDNKWRVAGYDTQISTVGELRTLARLAGVELAKGGE